jgi:hypothetical protein
MPRPTEWSLPFMSSYQNFIYVSHLSHTRCMPRTWSLFTEYIRKNRNCSAITSRRVSVCEDAKRIDSSRAVSLYRYRLHLLLETLPKPAFKLNTDGRVMTTLNSNTRAIWKVRGLTSLLRVGTLWRCGDGGKWKWLLLCRISEVFNKR